MTSNTPSSRWSLARIRKAMSTDWVDAEVVEELISTIERNAVDNTATIKNVSLWAREWRREAGLTKEDGATAE